MPDISWTEGAPPTTESAGLGPQQFQSLKTAIRTGLDAEHTWPTSGLGAGVHRFGSARVYYGPQSLVSSSGTDGRLMVTSDTSRLFHVGSAGTMLLGGAGTISIDSSPGGSRSYWAMEVGQGVILSNQTSLNVTFPNSGFSGFPFCVATPVGNEVNAVPLSTSATATNMSVSRAAKNVASLTFQWHSIGTRTS